MEVDQGHRGLDRSDGEGLNPLPVAAGTGPVRSSADPRIRTIDDSDTIGAGGQRWKHRVEGYAVLLEGWIPGLRGWSATRTGDGQTELVRDCDLESQFELAGEDTAVSNRSVPRC